MHRGRYAPRVPEQYLSADCAIPFFAPRRMKMAAQFIHALLGYDVVSTDWAAADVDVNAKTIRWIGTFATAIGDFGWDWLQNRNGSPTELQMDVVVTDPLGFTLRTVWVVPVAGWMYTVDPNYIGTSSYTTTGNFSTSGAAFGCFAKQWR